MLESDTIFEDEGRALTEYKHFRTTFNKIIKQVFKNIDDGQ